MAGGSISSETERNADRAKGTWSDLGMGPSTGAVLQGTLVQTVSYVQTLRKPREGQQQETSPGVLGAGQSGWAVTVAAWRGVFRPSPAVCQTLSHT